MLALTKTVPKEQHLAVFGGLINRIRVYLSNRFALTIQISASYR